MGPGALEVADIFRVHGPALRLAQRSHLSLGQLKVMTAIEQCRTAALGGHVLRCPDCQHDQVSYNSCRNRHCPKCQANAAKRWLQARQADLLPVDYYHVVFTLPAPISDIAYYNKAVVYGLLFEIAAETLITIAADPKHLGAEVGATLVLHTWGSALTHHPHVHGIVPGGGLSPDGKRWVSCKPGFFLSGGFHRIRHFGLIANNGRKEKLVLARQLLNVVPVANIEVTVDAVTYASAALNGFFSIPVGIIRRRAALPAPLAGQPGPFSLGDPDVLVKRLSDAGFKDVQVERVVAPVRLDAALDCLQFEQESFGALHQMLSGLSEPEKDGAWAEIEDALGEFEHDGRFEGPCEMLVASATK